MQIESMGYFVIEWPDAYRKSKNNRYSPYSKMAFRHLTGKVVDVLAGKQKLPQNSAEAIETRMLAGSTGSS